MTQMHVRENRQTRRRDLVLRWSVSTNKEREQTISFGVPAGISVKEGVRLSLGEAEPVVIGYSFCGPRMCLATSPLDAKMVAAIKAGQKASASYVLGSKRLMQVDLDLKGFGEAYDYLVQQVS
jgi:invasion protein IalB